MIVFTLEELDHILDRLDLMLFGPEVSPICCRIGENEYVRILCSAMDKWNNFGLSTIFTKEELDVTIDALHLSAEFGEPGSVDTARSAEHKVKEYLESLQ